ncbi:hypothetical protein ACFWN1_21515 [Streptomyces sp. NPDC058459]|uniref:hypothetical protein n=1 Tax=Streptomyces sp. NPDC058459 TaxID=3346508 RepID=UPI0036556C36
MSRHSPSGDQPEAIAAVEKHVRAGESDAGPPGATGSGGSAVDHRPLTWSKSAARRPRRVCLSATPG